MPNVKGPPIVYVHVIIRCRDVMSLVGDDHIVMAWLSIAETMYRETKAICICKDVSVTGVKMRASQYPVRWKRECRRGKW